MEIKEGIFQKANEMLIEWNRNFSSTMITDPVVGSKIKEKLRKFQEDDAYDNDEEKEYIAYGFRVFMKKNNNLCKELSKLHDDYDDFVKDNNHSFDTTKDIKAKNIWDLAVLLAYVESHERLEIESLDEWKKAILSNLENTTYSDEAYNECHMINEKLRRIHDKILPKYLAELGFDEILSIKSNRKKELDEKTNKAGTERNSSINLKKKKDSEVYVKPDILFLLECFYYFMRNRKKKWVNKEDGADFGRSFLGDGNGIMRSMLRKNLISHYDKFLYLDAMGSMLFNTLFVFPRSMYQDLFWKKVTDFTEICDPSYAKHIRSTLADTLAKIPPVKIGEKNSNKSDRDDKTHDYSIVDELYWNLQFQKMDDFVAGLDKCLDNQMVYPACYDDVNELVEHIRTTLDDHFIGVDTVEKQVMAEDECAKHIAIWFILRRLEGYSEESIRKRWQRNKEAMKSLYQFYERGAKCFRNESYFFDDFRQAAFFEPDENIHENVLPIARRVYIKGVLLIFFVVLGKEKIFSKGENGIEKKISLYQIVNDYREKNDEISDMAYSMNGTYYLLWNCLNEILEWGFSGAKSVNDFRKNVFLPYCRVKGIGLKYTTDEIKPITMDDIRKEIRKSAR